MEKIVGATIADYLNTIPDHVKNNNEFSRGQNKEYLAHLTSWFQSRTSSFPQSFLKFPTPHLYCKPTVYEEYELILWYMKGTATSAASE